MPATRVFLLLIVAAFPAFAQEESGEQPLLELAAEVVQQFEQRIAEIEQQERAIVQIREKAAAAEGVASEIYGGRVDVIWPDMFENAVRLATDIAEQQEAGYDVTSFSDTIARTLVEFPQQASTALDNLRKDIVFPDESLPPAEFAIQDQYLFLAVQKLDYVLNLMADFLEVAERIDIEHEADVEFLQSVLEESAANRSAFLLLALENVDVIRAAAAALPDDTDLAARLAVHEARTEIASTLLQDSVDLMKRLDLDSSQYRQQVLTSTGELTSDVLDVSVLSAIASEWSAVVADVTRTEGPRLIFRLLTILVILFFFIWLGRLAQSLTKRALRSSRIHLSALLTEMIVATVKNLFILLGILIALSQIGISLGPLLAGLGIAGFIIGFALQDTLSNFASGMLILMYRPFDVGDFVTAGGVTGKVSHMSLVNTTFKTIDNQVLVVPNNLIWSSVITNVTAQRTRRVDLVFGVAYSDDVEKVEKILSEVVAEHELVLKEPEPMIKLHELAESSVNFVVRPWVKTDDYWDVYWDLQRAVKVRFDVEGITIPFPQREVHTVAG